GGAQVDRFGNINTTVIGAYDNPKIRLPGSGGASEIAYHSQRLLIMMRMNPRSFVEKCDFVTSPGHKFVSGFGQHDQGKDRSEFGMPGRGPTAVITELGVLEFVAGEMVLTEIYPGVSPEEIQKACGWALKMA